ncbi:MAG: trypsin-like peptidase domain-containing protein [Lachnospiraceae bacterium]
MDEDFNYYGRQTNADNNESLNSRENSSSLYSYSYINKESDTCSPFDAPQKKGKKKKEKGKKSFKNSLIKCAVFALVFGLIAGGSFSAVVYFTDGALGGNSKVVYGTPGGKQVSTTSTNSATTVTDVSDIVREVMPSIVAITNVSEVQVPSFFGSTNSYEQPSCGSGIIIAQDDEHILIATNNHVVADAKSLTVSFHDDKTATATVKGTDPGSDLAVLTVNIKDIPEDTLSKIKVAVMGKSDDLVVGESAIAIGNALGYGQSVTTGVISALNREVTVENVTNAVIQTDAAINPGNSGGALLNLKGEVIGINSAKYSETDVEGIGFAIPISTAESIIEDIISRKAVAKKDQAYLGIYGVDVSEDVSQVYQMPIGIYITQLVEGGPAEKAGLNSGDIITKFDGKKVASMEELQRNLAYYEAGKKVDVTVQAPGDGKYKEKKISVTLASISDKQE